MDLLYIYLGKIFPFGSLDDNDFQSCIYDMNNISNDSDRITNTSATLIDNFFHECFSIYRMYGHQLRAPHWMAAPLYVLCLLYLKYCVLPAALSSKFYQWNIYMQGSYWTFFYVF